MKNDFLEKSNMPSKLEKKRYEIVLPFLYNWRVKKYRKKVEKVEYSYNWLAQMIKNCNNKLQGLLSDFSYQPNLAQMPEFDFSDMDEAHRQIMEVQKFCASKEYQEKQKDEAERVKRLERRDFIQKVIKEMPESSRRIELSTYTDSFAPSPSSEERKEIENMLKVPQSGFVERNWMGNTIYFCFYPDYNAEEQLEKIIEEWRGIPHYAVVSYT